MAKFLNRLGLPFRSANPSPLVEAEMWYDSITDQVKYKPGGSSIPLAVTAGSRFDAYLLGVWYMTQPGPSTTATTVLNRAYAAPIVITRAGTISGLALEISTAWATTAGTVRAGIYNDDGSLEPTALVADFGTVAATAGIKTYAASVTVTPGIYWTVGVIQGASGTAGSFRSVSGIPDYIGSSLATPPSAFFNGSANCYWGDGFSTTLPATFGGTGEGTLGGPRFAVKFSA